MVNHQPENGLYRPNPDEEFFYIRSQLTAYLSCDDGKTWSKQLLLDERDGVSYPDVAQDDNGDIYIIYDYNRYKDMEILMAVIRETEDNARKSHQNAEEAHQVPHNRRFLCQHHLDGCHMQGRSCQEPWRCVL